MKKTAVIGVTGGIIGIIAVACAIDSIQILQHLALDLIRAVSTSATAAGGEHCQSHHAGQKGGCETLEHFHCNVPPVFKF